MESTVQNSCQPSMETNLYKGLEERISLVLNKVNLFTPILAPR